MGTTPLHLPATLAPVLLISHLQLRAMRAGVTPQDTTLDQPLLCRLVAPLLEEAGFPRPPLEPETSSTLSITKVNEDRTSRTDIVRVVFQMKILCFVASCM